MTNKILCVAASVAAGILYFILGIGPWLLLGLFALTLILRLTERFKNSGKFVEILFIFYFITYAIYSLGIYHPYSLIIVLTALVALIFYEGPEWGQLYFIPANTAAYFKTAILLSIASLTAFAVTIYFRYPELTNPAPLQWPLDALILVGVGFAFYRALVEEIIFRSFIFQRANSAAGGAVAVVAQGVMYGLMQYRVGVPPGIEGLTLGSLYGFGLGYLVFKSESIFLAIFVQFVVTLGVFVELIILGRL